MQVATKFKKRDRVFFVRKIHGCFIGSTAIREGVVEDILVSQSTQKVNADEGTFDFFVSYKLFTLDQVTGEKFTRHIPEADCWATKEELVTALTER